MSTSTSTNNNNNNKPIKIATRKSHLAQIQAQTIVSSLKKLNPELEFEIVTLQTRGDKDQATALYEFGGDKSLWTSELEELLVVGDVDCVVHCLKDMPTNLPPTCHLGCIPTRDDPRDCLIIKSSLCTTYQTLSSLPRGSIIGTSSIRRTAQLTRLHPHLSFSSIRGNVETRLSKTDSRDSIYAAMVMSAAGLQRVGLEGRINEMLGRKQGGIMYAVGQGALGLEVRKGDKAIMEIIGGLRDQGDTLACLAERSLLRTLEGGCSVPVGVETEWIDRGNDESEGGRLGFRACVTSVDGRTHVEDVVEGMVTTEEQAEELGRELARKLTEKGADEILREINATRLAKS